MRRKQNNRRAGISLLEVVIASAILAVALGVPVMLARSADQAFLTGRAATALDARGRRVLDQIVERLRAASADNITPPGMIAPLSGSRIDFQRAVDFVAGAVVWGSPERIEFQRDPGELDDGQDNDSDGLIDEGGVVWIRDLGMASENASTLCGWVSERAEDEQPGNGLDDNGNGLIDEAGLSFDVAGGVVNVRLTLERPAGRGRTVTHTLQRSIALDN
jgi:hypothetical protein